jgi:tRNA A-37 threonylcarbamoyl transferase component Bud32
MHGLKKTVYGKYCLYSPDRPIDPSALVDAFLKADILEGRGRGSIKILTIDGKIIACRKYLHGGLFRGITKDYFFSAKRAVKELEIIDYLKNAGFPVVEPYGVIVEANAVMKNPYLLTVFEKDAINLLDFFSKAEPGMRQKTIKELAVHMYDLERLGVYHPDLHLNNILITKNNGMKFLDFDKAYRKSITKEDMERMFWRLNRHAEKMAKKGYVNVHAKEKILFLRSYERLSGYDMLPGMEKHMKFQGQFDRIGWFLDSFLYKSNSK